MQKAKLCITHAGPGTILESIFYNVPLVAIPVADDQPAMAARVAYHKIGVSIPYRKLSADKLKDGIEKVLRSSEINDSVAKMSKQFRKYKGTDEATNIILKGVTGNKNV